MVYNRPYVKPGPEYPDGWNKIRYYIFKRDGYRCQICGRTSQLVCHHIRPIKCNGSHHASNLITVCQYCHKRIHKIKD